MTETINASATARSAPANTNIHLFAPGQSVRLRSDHMQRHRKIDVFRIVGMLPPVGEFPQYRIRNESEPHDRVATQDKLELVITPFDGA